MAFKLAATVPTKVNVAAGTNATSLRVGNSALFWLNSVNTAAYAVYVKFYDKATAPTVGTDVPVLTVMVSAGAPGLFNPAEPVYFSKGLAYAVTKLSTDTDTTAVVAGDLIFSFATS